MTILAQTDFEISQHDMSFGYFVLAVLTGCGVWALVRWIRNAPCRSDPWDDSISQEIDREETQPLCHRCLEPHKVPEHFCPKCGAPVSEYTNLMPLDYCYSIGHTLRIGAS